MTAQKIIIVEGPDGSGKTTLVEHLVNNSEYKLLNFPKKLPDSTRFEIKTHNDVKIFETLLEHLDTNYTYVLDRSYISNYVYGMLRNEPEVDKYFTDISRLMNNHFVKVIPLTRDKIDSDFEDDNIKLTKTQFNDVIDIYDSLYNTLGLIPVNLHSIQYDYSVLGI